MPTIPANISSSPLSISSCPVDRNKLLKPLDLIQPYRLEMGTKMTVGKNKNLYDYWKKKITAQLNAEWDDNEVFVNLASNEYFKAIDKKALKVPVYNVSFKELKNGQYKTIGFFAKYARGLMTRFIIDHKATSVEDLKAFNAEDYRFTGSLSSENDLVFTR